jgi:hypothetical protein
MKKESVIDYGEYTISEELIRSLNVGKGKF